MEYINQYTYILRYFRNKINILRKFYDSLRLFYRHYGLTVVT